MKKLELTVRGMSCGGCSGRIERSLSKMEGIEEIDASHDDDRVVVTVGDDTDESAMTEQVVAKIEDLGFEPEAP